MDLAGKRIGVAMAASHHNRQRAFTVVRKLVQRGADIICVLSRSAVETPTKHGSGEDWVREAIAATGREPLLTIPEVEPFGPGRLVDALLVMPCTGNTLARLANAVNDSPVTMAAKATLRNGRPVVLAISTNDGLGLNAVNLARLLAAKHVYFVPFGQDDPFHKPASLDSLFELAPEAIAEALEGRQLQPLLVAPRKVAAVAAWNNPISP